MAGLFTSEVRSLTDPEVRSLTERERPLAPEEEELLNALKKIAEEATRGEPVGMDGLWSTITYVVNWYRADSWVADEEGKMNLHEIVDPARAVLAVLRNDANSGAVFNALGDGDFFEGIASRDALIADLEKLVVRGARHVRRKRPRTRPARIDLRLLVGHLANDWVILTNTHFSSDWHDGAPISLGARFVYEFVKVVDPASLPSLRTATRWVVHARRRGKIPGYFSSARRKDAI